MGLKLYNVRNKKNGDNIYVGLCILLDVWKFRFIMCLFILNFNIFWLNKFNKGWEISIVYVIFFVVKV